MDKNFKLALQNKYRAEKERCKIILSKNELSEDEKKMAQELLDSVNALIEALDKLPDDDPDKQVAVELKDEVGKLKAAIEKLQTTPSPQPTPTTSENYLKSNNALHDFLTCVKTGHNVNEVAAAWQRKLSENNIAVATGSEDFNLPDAMKGAIQDAWERKENWLNQLNNTRAKRFIIRGNTSTQSAETSRAKGHQPGATKAVETLNFAAKTVTPQMIYKIMNLDKMTEFNDDGSLLNYITGELVSQWIWEIQKCVLVGDGRETTDPNKINSFESIARSASDNYVTVAMHSTSTPFIDELVNLVSAINTDANDVVLVLSKSDLNTLRRVMLSTDSTPQYVSADIIAEQLGVAKIITTDVLGSAYKAIAFIPSKYVTVGNMNPQFVGWEDYLVNQDYYRYEAPAGGAVEGLKSAAVLKTA